jgi:hypothetical protein
MAAGNYAEAAKLIPSKISLATKEPPLCDLIKIIGRSKIIIFLKLELAKLSERVNVGGNLTASQIEFISTQLVEMFPNESLADFKICFERGAIGQYGEIFRMDGIVIRQWMEKYLDEKYQIIEEELKSEKDNPHAPVKPGEYNSNEHSRRLQQWLDQVQKDLKKVPGMSDKDIRKYGQEKPVRETITSGYKYFSVRGVEIYAITQEHAEELAAIMLKNKLLIQDGDELRRSDLSS